MVTLSQRVERAIDEVGKNHFEEALLQAAIAIDVTAKNYFKSAKSSKSNYKQLLKDYSWLIELMAFQGINLDDSRFGNYPIDGISEPSFQDLIYHTVRCNLVHGEGVPENFEFSDGNIFSMRKNHLILPKNLIWGLLAVVVFCSANSNHESGGGYWLGVFNNRFVIDDFWGQEQVIKRIYENRKLTRVAIIVPSGHMV